MNNDDQTSDTWVQFSEVAVNAKLRNALELFHMRKELPAAVGLGGGVSATGLPQGEDACGEELASGLSCTSAPDRLVGNATGSPQGKEKPLEFVASQALKSKTITQSAHSAPITAVASQREQRAFMSSSARQDRCATAAADHLGNEQ